LVIGAAIKNPLENPRGIAYAKEAPFAGTQKNMRKKRLNSTNFLLSSGL
jgi:hypothetical protein